MLAQSVQCLLQFAIFTRACAGEARQLSYAQITGYEPDTDVTQHNRLDLDQKEIEAFLAESTPNFASAQVIYESGANSGARATLTVPALSSAIEKSAEAKQGSAALGTAYAAYEAGATAVKVTYTSTCVATTVSTAFDTTGCFTTDADVTVAGTSIGTPSVVQNTYRTLKGFSTQAQAKMTGHVTFEKFNSYYKAPDYADAYVMSAFSGTGAWAGKTEEARTQGVKKGTAYMNNWMYTIREMEDAIDDCTAGCSDCNMDPVHAWDEGVAFYSGSLEGTDGSGTGHMLYNLADKRCANFNTCQGGSASGTAQVNIDVMNQFRLGQDKLNKGECSAVGPIRDKIISIMTVPLVQGVLRYAYKSAQPNGKTPKNLAEGAVFAAAVLPLVHSCSATAAKTIYDNMKIDSADPMGAGYAAVKTAIESVYSCLGITCAHVGGLVLTADPLEYYAGAEPCQVSNNDPEPENEATEDVSDGTVTRVSTAVFGVVSVANLVSLAGQ